MLALEELPELVQPDDEAAGAMGGGGPSAGKARTAVHLYYAEGYSAEEISRLMHVPAATVRTRLHRARRQLKELLGGNDDEACVSRFDE